LRAPSDTLVLDAAVLISAALGKSAPVIGDVALVRMLVTTARVVEEVRGRISSGMRRPDILPAFERLLEEVTVVPLERLELFLSESGDCLRDAVASRNGSSADAHVLALAWEAAADIWSADRDFAGTGVASWSTANLLRALAEAEA
jgi:predicted nucleic acid-binding protein